MSGEIFGGQGLIVLVVALIGLAVPIWALVDAVLRPAAAFAAAGSSKGLWIALIIVFSLVTGIIGFVLAIVYLVSIRPRVQASTG